MEEDVGGKNVSVKGRFEFVLKRGKNRVFVVEAKTDDIDQGMAQNVAGLEALSDVEGLEQTFGIITDFLNWVFISDDEKIQKKRMALGLNESLPSIESLKEILGMIYAMLADNNAEEQQLGVPGETNEYSRQN